MSENKKNIVLYNSPQVVPFLFYNSLAAAKKQTNRKEITMTTTQYKNIIDHTVKFLSEKEAENSVKTAVKILANRGISLPDAAPSAIREALSGGDYLGWEACTEEEAQTAANDGIAVVGVSDDRVVVIEPELDGVEKNDNENITTVSDLSDEEKAGMSFYSGIELLTIEDPHIPDRIAQNHDDPEWNAALWGQYASISTVACASSCAAMALANINAGVSLQQILATNKAQYGNAAICYWLYGVPRAMTRDKNLLSSWVARYRNNPNKYSPPVVWVSTRSNSSSHYIVVFKIDGDTLYAVDPGVHGYDRTKHRMETNYWRMSDLRTNSQGYHIVQYYKN